MPKLPVVKAKDLLKTLQKMGFVIHHQAGSHVQLKHSDGRRVTVPYHPTQEIRRGTLKGIIEDIEISVEEFTEALKK